MTQPTPITESTSSASPPLGLGLGLTAPDGWRAAALVALVHALSALLVFDPTPQVGGDNAAYRSLAQALASGRGYVRLWEPGHGPETIYPPLFALFLSIPVRLGMDSWAALNMWMLPIFVTFAAAAYLWMRRVLTPAQALGCGLVIALSPGLLDLSHAVLSDLPFAALSAIGLWALHGVKARRDRGSPVPTTLERWMPAIAVGATFLAYLTRSAALPLAIIALGWLAWRRRWVASGVLAGGLAAFVAMWSRRARLAGGPSYGDFMFYIDPYQPAIGRMHAADWISRIAGNASHYGSVHLPTLLFGTDYGLPVLASWIVLGLALAGFVLALRRPSPSALWLPMYVGLLLLWPSTWSGERFLLPAYPLIIAYGVAALVALRERISSTVLFGAGAIGVAALLYADGSRAWQAHVCRSAIERGAVYACMPDDWGEYFARARQLRGHLPPGSVILARKPTIMYSESGYASAVYPFSIAPDTLFAESRRVGADYLLVDGYPLAERFVHGVLRSQPSRFCTVRPFRGGRTALLRFERDAAPVPARADTMPIADCANHGER